MAEGTIRFHAQHTPPGWDDPLESVTLLVTVNQVGGAGAVVIHKDMSTVEAREFAEQIIVACDLVDADRTAT